MKVQGDRKENRVSRYRWIFLRVTWCGLEVSLPIQKKNRASSGVVFEFETYLKIHSVQYRIGVE